MKKLVCALSIASLALAAAPAPAAEDGKALYDSKCAMCHGKDGVAKAMAKGSRNLNDPAYQKEATVESIVKVTEEGKGKMPASKGKLTPEQIKAIAEYVKALGPAAAK